MPEIRSYGDGRFAFVVGTVNDYILDLETGRRAPFPKTNHHVKKTAQRCNADPEYARHFTWLPGPIADKGN